MEQPKEITEADLFAAGWTQVGAINYAHEKHTTEAGVMFSEAQTIQKLKVEAVGTEKP